MSQNKETEKQVLMEELVTPKKPGHHPLARSIKEIRHFGDQVAQIRIKWLVTGIFIFLISVLLTQTQFNTINQQEREELARKTEQEAYINSLAAYNTQVVQYESCLETVTRAAGNRAWKTWLLNKLETSFPGSLIATDIVIEGRTQLDLLVPARSTAECHHPGPRPERPTP